MTITNLSQPSGGDMIRVQYINATGTGFASRFEVSRGTTLKQFLDSQNENNPSSMVVKVNNEHEAAEYVLKDNDKIVATVGNVKGN